MTVSTSQIRTPSALAWRRFRKNRAAWISLCVLGLLAGFAIFAPFISPHGFDEAIWTSIRNPPTLLPFHPFGTDSLGRDVFTRSAIGLLMSFILAILATTVSLTVGIIYGSISGYVGGKTDLAMMRVVDILYALPFMFIVILLTVIFGRQIWLLFIGVGLVEWLTMARVVRGQTLTLKTREFVEAARAMGAGQDRILRYHILPNLLGIVAVYATLALPQVILVESFLSFLGLGIQEPLTSLGVLIKDGADDLEDAPWLLLAPGGILMTLLMCLNLVGDGLRDALDPKER
jgi:oligopeptide transport system permease protein